MTGISVLEGDTREVLRSLPSQSVQCVVTSPPYYGLRDYGVDGQIGLEPTPDAYIAEMVAVFREVRRVLRDNGVCWLNLGDSYSAGGMGAGSGKQLTNTGANMPPRKTPDGYKPKDLLMIPARVALALQADGWWLRSEIVWAKPNPMPESVTDRPTSSHEKVFLLTKSATYFYDAEAVKEPSIYAPGKTKEVERAKGYYGGKWAEPNDGSRNDGSFKAIRDTRNLRNVWTIATKPFKGAHFATMPPALAETCIKAGSRPGDTVLDPFGGAGTTGLVAQQLGRSAILIELNPAYADMARERISGVSAARSLLDRLSDALDDNRKART